MNQLEEVCTIADAILVNIADSVIGKVSKMLVSLKDLDTYVQALLETSPAKIYPAVASNLNHYCLQLTEKTLKMKENLQTLFPAVKAETNGKSEQDLINIIQDYNLLP